MKKQIEDKIQSAKQYLIVTGVDLYCSGYNLAVKVANKLGLPKQS